MKKISALIAAGLLVGLSSTSVQALNATGAFNVTINFTSSCSVNTAGLAPAAFNYVSLQGTSATFGPLPFTVTCTNSAPYTVSLDAGGATYSGSYVAPIGTYTNASTGLTYQLLLPLVTTSTGTGVAQTWNLLGSMAAGQSGTCGTLGGCQPSVDIHTVTITY